MNARSFAARLALVARAAWPVLGTLAVPIAALALVIAWTDARADEAAGGLDPVLAQQIKNLAAAPPAAATRIEVVVGTLDPRLHLAPCERIEPYLPNGARLWGKTRVGLRCAQGVSRWNVYLPVTVRAWGRGIVATAVAGVGSTLQATDVTEGDVDLAESNSPALVAPVQAIGRVLAQPLKPGQSVRVAHLRARQWFTAGDTVRLVGTGPGFRLESEGQALSNGVEGQAARVRTDNGHVVTGAAVGERLVELTL